MSKLSATMLIKSATSPAGFPREPKRPFIQEKRSGVRMNSRVPVVIEWKDSAGGVLREEAFTRVVSPNGCMVVLQRNLALEQPLRILNRATEEIISAMVVSKGVEQPEGWELGIKLIQPPHDFWGLEL